MNIIVTKKDDQGKYIVQEHVREVNERCKAAARMTCELIGGTNPAVGQKRGILLKLCPKQLLGTDQLAR